MVLVVGFVIGGCVVFLLMFLRACLLEGAIRGPRRGLLLQLHPTAHVVGERTGAKRVKIARRVSRVV